MQALAMKERTQRQSDRQCVAGAVVVVGLGVTGLSVVRHLCARGENVLVMDTRDAPPALSTLRRELPAVRVLIGELDGKLLSTAARIILSPGVALSTPAVRTALDAGVEIVGDIELFVREASAPIAAITGSNGKSTVTAMLGEMASTDAVAARVGGNLGEPALALLDDNAGLYVLELSSFQLETTWSLAADVAAVLNISADHLDRYTDFAHYSTAKARIFNGARVAIVNLDDPQLESLPIDGSQRLGFSSCGHPDASAHLREIDGKSWLCLHGDAVMRADELAVAGRHNVANALAAMLMASELGISQDAMRVALQQFKGLPHRCALVATLGGVHWIDDSKGTNVGSTVAAIEGLGCGRNLLLIAGGLGKGQDFSPLSLPIGAHVHTVILIGADARAIDSVTPPSVRRIYAQSMRDAVRKAAVGAKRGDTVLLSPACASMDMFDNYVARGEAFCEAINGLDRA
ncbi:MAG: UDP-N-acetylmuramoylalanine--D-glutamate ligase [Gammaproteobacteria bacterium]|jgi:UDP-N-acetylmuramoylalanine--D-glutamate ligase